MNKSNLFSLFILFALIGLCYDCNAQRLNFVPGYVITNQNDSIHGLVLLGDPKFNTRRCVFKQAADSKEITYSPGEIVAYGSGRELYFRSYRIQEGSIEKDLFLDCLVRGKISLFLLGNRLFVSSGEDVEELTVEKESISRNGTNYNIKKEVYKSTLITILADCPTIGEQIRTTEFTQNDIVDVIVAYHRCINAEALVMKKETRKAHVRFGVSAGMQFYVMEFDKYASIGYPTSTNSSGVSFVPSVSVVFSDPKISGKLSFVTGISYKSMSNSIHDESAVTINIISDLEVNSSYLELPLTIRYNFLNRVPSVYLQGGVAAYFNMQWHDETILTTSSGFVLSEKVNSLKPDKFNLGFDASLGWALPVGKSKATLEAHYFIAPSVIQTSTLSPDIAYSGIVLMLGWQF